MGGFYLVSSSAGNDWLDLAERMSASFHEQGFAKGIEIRTKVYSLCLFGRTACHADSQLLRLSDPDTVIASSGTLIIAGLSGRDALQHLLANPATKDSWGNYCLIRGDSAHLTVEIDRLGLYKVYTARGSAILSSSFLAVCNAHSALSIRDQAVYEYLIDGATYGNETLFHEIHVLDPACSIDVGSTVRQRACRPRTTLEPCAASFDESVEDTLARLRQRFSDLAKASGGRIDTALSGGYDSRLIVALLQDAGVSSRIHVYGGEDTADVRIAKAIAKGEGFPIEHLDKSKLQTSADAYPSCVHENFLAMDGLAGDGIFNNGSDVESRRSRASEGRVALNGGGGEIYRNFFYLSDGQFTIYDVVRAFFCQFDAKAFSARFHRAAYLDCLVSKVAECFEHRNPKLNRAEVEWIYPFFRCRFWMGRNNSLNNRFGPALTPLLGYELSRQACSMPLSFKKHGLFEAALIRRLSPRLAAYPSEYGHNFSGVVPWRQRLAYTGNTRRPLLLREHSFMLKSRLGVYRGQPSELTPGAVSEVLPGGITRLAEYCRPERMHHPGQLQRLYSLEYLLRELDA